MAITEHTIDDYKAHLIAELSDLEGFHDGLPYYDRAIQNSEHEYQNVTIGYGINMDWSNGLHLRLVLNQLGLVESSTQLERDVRVENGLPLETEVEKVNRLNNMVAEFQQLFSEHRPAEGDNDVTYENTALQTALNNLSAQYGGGTFRLTEGQSEAIIRQIIDGIDIPYFAADNGKQARLDVGHRGRAQGSRLHIS